MTKSRAFYQFEQGKVYMQQRHFSWADFGEVDGYFELLYVVRRTALNVWVHVDVAYSRDALHQKLQQLPPAVGVRKKIYISGGYDGHEYVRLGDGTAMRLVRASECVE